MGDNTLTAIAEPATVEVDDVNKFRTALIGDSIPRNTSTGAPEDNVHKLGRATLRWNQAHITDLFLGSDGELFDPNAIGADTKFAIVAGATRTDSGQPDFLRASGAGATATLLATATDFQYTANNNSVTLTADVAIASLTTAPAANNTALVDDTGMAGGAETKFTGEDIGDPITIDTVGSEITDRIGEFICLKTPTGEFMLAFVEDATTLSKCFRGFFFDDNYDPVVRGVLSNNDTLTIMSLGWVFIDKNGTTIDVSYTSPTYSGVEPSAVLDDYWFDLKNRLWKRHNGTSFVSVDRTLIGLLVIDGTNAVASRAFDFTKSYDDFIDLRPEIDSVTVVRTAKGFSRLSVYGQNQELYGGEFLWDITSDLETGVSEAASTTFYLYVTEEGIPKISDERPFDRTSELRGRYHPYHSWRYIGEVVNNSSSDFDKVSQLFIRNGVVASVRVEGTPTTIDFDNIFRADKNYVIKLTNIRPTTDNVDLLLRLSNDKGQTYLSGASDYEHSEFHTSIGGALDPAGGADTSINLTGDSAMGNDNTATDVAALSGNINFYDPVEASNEARFEWAVSLRNPASEATHAAGSGKIRDLTNGQSPNSFQLLLSSGTFAHGKITIIEEEID